MTHNRLIIVLLGAIGLISLVGSFVLIALGKAVASEVIAPVGAVTAGLAAIANSVYSGTTRQSAEASGTKPNTGDLNGS